MQSDPTDARNRSTKRQSSASATNGGRTLVFHTGIHKTGSTALQAFLDLNVTRLEEAGVTYAYATGTGQGVGNGLHLFQMLREGGVSTELLDEMLTVYLGNCPTGIISSEDFTHFEPSQWQQIAEASRRLGARVKTITFIRDLAPYCASLHAQLVSAGEISVSLDDFVSNADVLAPVTRSLKSLMLAFQRDSMTVIHYESASGAIDRAFLGSLGLPSDSFDPSHLGDRANRSLTEYEQELVLRFNRSTGKQFARDLSRHLKTLRPNLVYARTFDFKFVEQLSARYTDDLNWINESFFNGQSVMQVVRKRRESPSENSQSEQLRQAIDGDVIEWCIAKLRTSQDEDFRYMGRLLRNIDWNLADNPMIPSDFDPIAYLAHNPDVVRNGSLPFRHYINNGHKEPDRRWKWTN